MGISGRKSKMSVGRLDNAVVKFTDTQWIEKTTTGGKDVVMLSTVFVDQDGQEHPYEFFLGEQRFVHVDDGVLKSVDENREYSIAANMAVGKLFGSLEDAGFSTKKLDKIDENPGALDEQWVHVIQKPGTALKQDGTPFTDLIVDELLDDPTSGSGKGKSSAGKGTSGKGKASTRVEEDEDEDADTGKNEDDDDDDTDNDNSGDDDDDEDSDEALARTLVEAIVANPAEYVRNYDDSGELTVKQAYTAAFSNFSKVLDGTDKKRKTPISNLVNEPAFHVANAKAGLYEFDKKTGVITVPTSKKKGRK